METDNSDTESDILSLKSPSALTISSYDVDSSIRSSSPVPSVVVSITSSMRDQIYKQEYGRNLNNYSDVYRLPADEEELERLDKQHTILADAMGGKYVPPMAAVMADDTPGETKACLDLGCGSGNWITDVARDFPHCTAVGIDLIPMQSSTMPPNLRSEVDDINLGLEHFYGDFNVVHARLISSGIKDYHLLIDQIARVLRPGGMFHVSEFDFQIYDSNHCRIELDVDELGPPWLARWMTHTLKAMIKSGGDVDAASHLHEWILNNPMFEDVVYKEFWFAAVAPRRDPSDDSEALRRMDQGLYDDCLAFMRSGRPLLLGYGFPPETVNLLEENVLQELAEKKIPQYTRLQCVYARKRQTSAIELCSQKSV
ncbi:S-adenosyl-L-methionine-dependent methyltransferase [Phlegmacium glaucopus]|nr:S-adenosyl-L-methionine-dependent methyltransferase [Phlegmacium glaucopus]